MLREISEKGAFLQRGRLFFFQEKGKVTGPVVGYVSMGRKNMELEVGERLDILLQYMQQEHYDSTHFVREVKKAYVGISQGKRMRSIQPKLKSSINTALPETCVLYDGYVYGLGGKDVCVQFGGKGYAFSKQEEIQEDAQERISPTQVRISVGVSPPRLREGGRTYLFDSATLSLDAMVSDTITLLRAPRVESGYDHPYVFADGSICFDGTSRWKTLGVQYSRPLTFSQGVVQGAKALVEATSLLHSYFGNVTKVHDLDTFTERAL